MPLRQFVLDYANDSAVAPIQVRGSKQPATFQGFSASKGVSWRLKMSGRDRTKDRHGALRVAALALCLVTFLFVIQTASHSHVGGKNDSACQLCRVTHTGISAAPASGDAPLPLIQRGRVSNLIVIRPLEVFLHSVPSRAPPSA